VSNPPLEGLPIAVLETLYYIPDFGRQGWKCRCSLCGEELRVYEWSIAGTGKRCPGCGHLYSEGDLDKKERG